MPLVTVPFELLDEEVEKLDRWSDDLKIGLEREIKEIDIAIRDARKAGALAASLSEKLEAQRQIKDLETSRKKKRAELYVEQDKVDERRNELIGDIEKQLTSRHVSMPVFQVRWVVR